MGALAQSTPKRGRDYAQHAVDKVLATVDAEDRAWLESKLAAPPQEITAPSLAALILQRAVPEYAPELDFLLDVDMPERVRNWRQKHVT